MCWAPLPNSHRDSNSFSTKTIRTRAKKKQQVREALEENPEKSNVEIAEELGVSDPFVGKVRKEMEEEARAYAKYITNEKFVTHEDCENFLDEIEKNVDIIDIPSKNHSQIQELADQIGKYTSISQTTVSKPTY